MKIGFIGVGKLGKESAEIMAEKHEVIGYDVTKVEPANFQMVSSIEEVCKDRELIFIAVPTPHHPDYDGREPTSHLPNKDLLNRTMEEIGKALKPGGRVVAMGPNISILKGRYWDFWDHHVALSDASLGELLEIHSFNIEYSISKFLPYNMVRVKQRPLFLLSLYLKLPLAWAFLGKQFLIVARKN